MEDLFDIPQEFLDPLLPCFDLLKRCNVVIFDQKKSFWQKYWRSLFIIPCVVLYHASLSMYMGKVFSGDIELVELAYVVSIYVVCTQAILKAVIVSLKKKEIRTLIVQLGRMWKTGDLTKVQINKKNALLKKLKFCYAVFYWMNIIGSWQYIMAPLLETVFRKYILQQECGLLLPFSCSYPFDPSGSWIRYIGVYIFETYSMFRIVYYYLGTEFLMITLCSHLSTMFSLLSEELLHNRPENGNMCEDNINGIKRIVVKHQKLICLSKQLDDVFNKMIFVNLSSANITICFFGFSAKVAHGVLDMVNNFVAVIALILPIFNLCYYGELLRETSSNMAISAYNDLWYECGLKYQKLMWFIIRRSQKPCSLTSLKHTPIALNTFTAVLSTTWSYFSLASSLYEGES
ncbi:odorant receptor 4-like [Anticarsia gemmatalis]|uniref:odorant receptor 4-like n=1 Tax=Anticarsia gemmatalis TaxID=129554 RepID=UPI003F765843